MNCYFHYRWGQIFILDSLANYTPKDEREAQSVCERVTPRLAHANAAVVLSAVKVKYSKLTPITVVRDGLQVCKFLGSLLTFRNFFFLEIS